MSECIYQKFFKRSTLTVLGAALVFMLICIVINFYYDWLSLWKKDKNVIWSLLIILFYLYPFLYSSVKQILKKKKEFSEIYSNNNLEKLENNLNQFEFYSIGGFLAELFKQFSSLWIFIFVQKIFEQVSSEQMEVVKQVRDWRYGYFRNRWREENGWSDIRILFVWFGKKSVERNGICL